jgi:hypothetical protein
MSGSFFFSYPSNVAWFGSLLYVRKECRKYNDLLWMNHDSCSLLFLLFFLVIVVRLLIVCIPVEGLVGMSLVMNGESKYDVSWTM